VSLTMSRCDKLLGMSVPFGVAMGALTRLGLKVEPGEGAMSVTVPERRPDLQREDDLIEEVGRIYGYEHIPDELPLGRTLLGHDDRVTQYDGILRDLLVRSGLAEVVNHTLTAPSPVDEQVEYVRPRTPAGPELSILRCGVLSGIVGSALRNLRRGVGDLALFEIGRVFRMPFQEAKQVGILLCGRQAPPNWQSGEKGPQFDFFALKGIVESLLGELGVSVEFAPCDDKRLHPGRCAAIGPFGVMGELHPDLAAKLDLPAGTLVAELSVDGLRAASGLEFSYAPPPRFPSVRRDLAFEVGKGVAYSRLEATVRAAGGSMLEDLRLFDVYEGKGIAEGSHSLAVALTLRKADGTLTDEEANATRERVFEALAGLGAKRR
jgi:phenylalanyl-tRNA synthetase beta chain